MSIYLTCTYIMTSNFDRTRKEIHAKETYRHFPYGVQIIGISFHTYLNQVWKTFPTCHTSHVPP